MCSRRRIPIALLLLLSAALLISCGGAGSGSPPPPAGWMQLSIPGPSPRWAHLTVLDSARQQAVLFAGSGGGSEVWIFSFANQSWTRVDAPNPPSPRVSPSAVADPLGDRMVVVGGIINSPTDEVWAFSFASKTWSQLPKGPSPRFDMGAATDGLRGWFYGGFLPGLVATDELWQFEFATQTWSLLPQSSVRPSPRTNMGIAFHAGSLYIIGGHDANGVTPGSWRYDFSSNAWTQLSPTGTPGAGAHFASATDDVCGVLLLAGGDHDDNIDVNTTDVFNFSQPSFVRLPTASDFVPARRHSALVLEPQSRTLLLFGGLHDPSQLLGDTWTYHATKCPQ